MSTGQTGHKPGGVPPKFFMFIGFFSFPRKSGSRSCFSGIASQSVARQARPSLSPKGGRGEVDMWYQELDAFALRSTALRRATLRPTSSAPTKSRHFGQDAVFGAYSWKHPACSGAFLSTAVFGSFLLAIGASLLTVGAFLPKALVGQACFTFGPTFQTLNRCKEHA